LATITPIAAILAVNTVPDQWSRTAEQSQPTGENHDREDEVKAALDKNGGRRCGHEDDEPDNYTKRSRSEERVISKVGRLQSERVAHCDDRLITPAHALTIRRRCVDPRRHPGGQPLGLVPHGFQT
jgi:hypothetical protein